MPIRRPYTTNRPQCTQSNRIGNPNVVQSTMNRYQLDRDTHSTFQLVFQVRIPSPCQYTDSSHKFAMRRRHSPNCDETITADEHNALNTLKRTGSHVPLERSKCSVPSLPLVKSPRFLATIRRRLTPLTIPTTRGLAGLNRALASKPVVARIAAGPLLRSQRCARRATPPLAAGSPCNLPVAAAGGVVARRCAQVLLLVLTNGVGRRERKCTGLRARFTRRGYSVADRCYPRHNLTRALVRKASSQEGRKEQ